MGGNAETLNTYNIPIIGGKDYDKATKTPSRGKTLTISEEIKAKARHTPCYTQDTKAKYV